MRGTIAALGAATTLVLITTPVAVADTGQIGGGTTVTTTLTSPAAGGTYVAGNDVPVSGTVAVSQGAARKDTNLAFVLDTSGSTTATTSLPCGTTLNCEKTATRSVITSVSGVRSPIAQVGVVAFPGTQSVPLQDPATFSNDLSAFTSGGDTQFDVGITRARDMLTAPGITTPKHVMVLLTDGDGTNVPVSGVGNIVIEAFAIAGAGCSATLNAAVSQGAAGSSCTVVQSLDALPSVVSNTLDSSLDSVDITVNGTVVKTLPVTAQGQSTSQFSTTLSGLAAGNGQAVCAVAHVTDAGGSGTVSDCHTINVLPAGTVVVDCTTPGACTGTTTDPGKSSLVFNAPPGLNEVVTLAPTAGAPADCGGNACRTGYNIGFPTTGSQGPVVSATVTTAQPVSLADRLKAAVFIDGKRITAQCNNRVLIGAIRTILGIPEPIPCITIAYQGDGRVQYFVKFKGDPKVTFR